jgi:hypothetical protein
MPGRGNQPNADDITHQEEEVPMADQYKCKKCSKTSPKPGSCCGQAMEKVS